MHHQVEKICFKDITSYGGSKLALLLRLVGSIAKNKCRNLSTQEKRVSHLYEDMFSFWLSVSYIISPNRFVARRTQHDNKTNRPYVVGRQKIQHSDSFITTIELIRRLLYFCILTITDGDR